jgi:hypothetical protein
VRRPQREGGTTLAAAQPGAAKGSWRRKHAWRDARARRVAAASAQAGRGAARCSRQGKPTRRPGQQGEIFFANSSLDCATGCLFELYCHSKIEILFQ